MRPVFARRPSVLLHLACCLLGIALTLVSARADLVWDAKTGWQLEGGALSGAAGPGAKNALDLMNKARAAEEKGSRKSAISSYQTVAKKYSNSVYAPEALFRSAQLRIKGKDYTKAFDDLQQLVSRYPNTRRFNEVIGEQYRIASLLLDGARGRMLWGLLPGFTQRDKAIEFFEIVLANAPYGDYAPLALMNVARGHNRLGNVPEAADALDRMINNYSQTLLAPDAYLRLAQTHASLVDGPYYDQGATKEAITYFTDFMLLFPVDQNIAVAEGGLDGMKTMLAESKMKMADFYFYKRNNFRAARVFYNEAITAYPESAISLKAKERLAEMEAKISGAATSDTTRKKRFFFF